MRKNANPVLLVIACILTIYSGYLTITASHLKEFITGIGLLLMCVSAFIGFFIEKTKEARFPETLYQWLAFIAFILIVIGTIL
jgi:hypothetical protein